MPKSSPTDLRCETREVRRGSPPLATTITRRNFVLGSSLWAAPAANCQSHQAQAGQCAEHDEAQANPAATLARRFERTELQRPLALAGRFLVLGVIELAGVAPRRHA